MQPNQLWVTDLSSRHLWPKYRPVRSGKHNWSRSRAMRIHWRPVIKVVTCIGCQQRLKQIAAVPTVLLCWRLQPSRSRGESQSLRVTPARRRLTLWAMHNKLKEICNPWMISAIRRKNWLPWCRPSWSKTLSKESPTESLRRSLQRSQKTMKTHPFLQEARDGLQWSHGMQTGEWHQRSSSCSPLRLCQIARWTKAAPQNPYSKRPQRWLKRWTTTI